MYLLFFHKYHYVCMILTSLIISFVVFKNIDSNTIKEYNTVKSILLIDDNYLEMNNYSNR
jgi:hypothetical protein